MSEFIKVKSLPIISVAHNFNSEKYNNFLPKTSNYLEIGYLKFGKMTYESCGMVTTLKENEQKREQLLNFNADEEVDLVDDDDFSFDEEIINDAESIDHELDFNSLFDDEDEDM